MCPGEVLVTYRQTQRSAVTGFCPHVYDNVCPHLNVEVVLFLAAALNIQDVTSNSGGKAGDFCGNSQSDRRIYRPGTQNADLFSASANKLENKPLGQS